MGGFSDGNSGNGMANLMVMAQNRKSLQLLTLSLPSDQNHHHEGFLYRAVTCKRLKLEIPAWSGFEGLEKIFPTVMWFFYLEIFLVAI